MKFDGKKTTKMPNCIIACACGFFLYLIYINLLYIHIGRGLSKIARCLPYAGKEARRGYWTRP